MVGTRATLAGRQKARQDNPNAGTEMGFTEAWPGGMLDERNLILKQHTKKTPSGTREQSATDHQSNVGTLGLAPLHSEGVWVEINVAIAFGAAIFGECCRAIVLTLQRPRGTTDRELTTVVLIIILKSIQ